MPGKLWQQKLKPSRCYYLVCTNIYIYRDILSRHSNVIFIFKPCKNNYNLYVDSHLVGTVNPIHIHCVLVASIWIHPQCFKGPMLLIFLFFCVVFFVCLFVFVFLFCFLLVLYQMLLISLYCPFLVTPSVFSNVYILYLFSYLIREGD